MKVIKNEMIMKTYNDDDSLASKMLTHNDRLASSRGSPMRSKLINKNLCLYFWLKNKIGKKCAFVVANTFEKAILIFGREAIPHLNRDENMPEEQE